MLVGQTDAKVWRFFSIFQDGDRPILDVRNFKIVMVKKFKRAKLCHWPKFRADRSNGCGGMSIFYFQDGGRHHLGFSNFPNRARDMAISRFSNMADAAILDSKNLNF